MKVLLAAIVLLCSGTHVLQAARILGVFPHIGKSHYLLFEPIMKTLANRGHEVVVITHFPLKNPPANYKSIDVNGSVDYSFESTVPVDVVPREELNIFCVYELADMGIKACEGVLGSKPIQDLLKSNEKFDLIIYELFNADCFLGFIHRFKALSIAVASSSFMPWTPDRFGLPDNPSYIANHFTGLSDMMSFSQRLSNTLHYLASIITFPLISDRPNYAIAKKYFGDDLPPLSEIAKNTSVFFINTHFSLNQVRPYTPNVVEIAGIHVGPPGKLSKDLQEFLDGAKEGVIYFCLGSTAHGASLPEAKRDAFLQVFKDLPQKVLWKWEIDSMPNKPANVKIVKWLPQSAVLAHPNVKLFITHAGLMGTIEAVYYGVPMISIPLFGDQYQNAAMAVRRGIAVKLPLNEINVDNVRNALNTALKDNSYQEQAKKVSRLFHDRPQKPMDSIIYWTEYVLKHKGATHMQSAAVHVPLLQYLLLDVIVALSIVPIILVILLVLVVRWMCKGKKQVPKKAKSQQKPKRS